MKGVLAMESGVAPVDAPATICAVSTPPGTGGIAVIRVSGPDAIAIADSIWRGKRLAGVASHTLHLGEIADREGRALDQGVAAVFRAPGSYTGEDTVEFSIHGSPYVQRELVATLCAHGARVAGAGEFTRRAFLSGHLGLTQAEAVADLIAADSRASHALAMGQMKGGFAAKLDELGAQLLELTSLLELELDFSEEDVEFADRGRLGALAEEIRRQTTALANSFSSGQAIKEGIPVAIVGATNAGKSSLLNALAGDDRAIVSDVHGTTRDTVEEVLEEGGFKFRFIDTAGLRETDDEVERLGIGRSRKAMARAQLILAVVDATAPDLAPLREALAIKESPADYELPPVVIVVLNKCDLIDGAPLETLKMRLEGLSEGEGKRLKALAVSAKRGTGMEELRKVLAEVARSQAEEAAAGTDVIVVNARHAEALREAAEASRDVAEALEAGLSGDLVAQHARRAVEALGRITGRITTDQVLANIFSRFCIGK